MSEDTALERALNRRDTLRLELEKIESFIALYQDIFGDAGDAAAVDESSLSASASTQRNRPTEIVEAIADVLRSAGRPLMRGDIVERLEARGVMIHSSDKPRYIGTLLWRNSERFRNVEGMGYSLNDMIPDSGQSEISQ